MSAEPIPATEGRGASSLRPVQRLIGGVLDAVVIGGIFAGIGLLLRGSTPSLLFLVIGRLLLAAYLLLRDVTGVSPGKHRMKLRVASAGGGDATIGQCILRNVTLAAVPISADIPVAIQVAWLLVLAEVVLVALGRDRLGDLLAQTTVVSTAPAQPPAPPPPTATVPDVVEPPADV